MKHTQAARAAAALTVATGALVAGAWSPASAQSDSQGCASGQTTYETSFLVTHGFSAAFLDEIDLNADGLVCGRPLSPQQQEKFCSQFPEGCQQPVILVFSDNYRGKGF